MTNLFAENSDVAFMDVNLREDAIRQGPNGEAYNPGKLKTMHYTALVVFLSKSLDVDCERRI